MKKPIIYNLFFSVLMMLVVGLCFTACKNNDKDEELIVIEDSRELFLTVNDDLEGFLKSNRETTFDDVINYIGKYGKQIEPVVKDSVLSLLLPDDYQIDVDLYHKIIRNDESGDYDESVIKNYIDDIREQLALNNYNANSRGIQEGVPAVYNQNNETRGWWSDVIIKRKILIWALKPNLDDERRDEAVTIILHDRLNVLADELKGCGLENFSVETLKGQECTLETIKNFDDYGIVFVNAHGTQDGKLCYPKEYMSNKEWEKINSKHTVHSTDDNMYWVLSAEHLAEYIPNMNKTLIWAAVCHAYQDNGKSLFSAVKKKCAGFVGTTNTTNVGESYNMFEKFAFPFFAGSCASDAFLNSIFPNRAGYHASFEGNENIYAKNYVQSKAQVKNETEAVQKAFTHIVTSQFKYNVNVSDSRSDPLTRALISGDEEVGVSFKNKKTGEVMEFIIDEDNSTQLKVYKYKGLVHAVREINTDKLPDGTYEYRTYHVSDGKKEYSDETYEFEVKRINKVVPEWLLEMMEPYIPIYEGDNPPMVEGTYLLSPQKLFYDSSKQYSSGKIFADNFLFFTDQDEVQDTINFVGFEVNNNGDIISEKYGEGAFISGEGNDFSIFFNTAGEHYFNDGYSYSNEALIVSGTKASTGIRDIYYAFAMVDKYDPYNHLMPIGAFRVFIDGDGMTEYIDLTNSASIRTRSNVNNQIPLLSIEADNDHCFTFQRSVPFYEWKNRMDKLKRIRIVNGKKVKK